MARDVEFGVTASDKTGAALASAEAKFKQSQERMRRESKKTGDGLGDSLGDGIGKATPGILSKIQGAFKLGGATGGQLLGVGVAAAAPFIGAAVSAAIIGGVGAAGVLGGVALAVDDPRVEAAGKRLGINLLSGLREDADGFVEPVLRNIGKIEARFESMRGRIQRIFDNAADFVDPLVDGALDGLDGILRGVDALVRRGGPVMDALGDSIGILGDSIGDTFEVISGGSEDAASALRGLATAAGETLQVFGYVIRALTEVYGVVSYIPSKISAFTTWLGSLAGIEKETAEETDGLSRALEMARVQFENNADGIERTNQYLADSEKKMQEAAQATRDLTSANMSLYDSETNMAEALHRATQARKENGRTLDVNTEKGRANRNTLSQVARAALSQYDAFVKVNGVGPQSAALAERLRANYVRAAQSFGASSKEANRLANSIFGIPSQKNTKINADPRSAIEASKAAKAAINSVNSRTVTVNVKVNASRLASIENRLNRLGGSMYNAAGVSWSPAGGGVSRVGGPTPVSVSNNVSVSLDGAPFYAMTAHAVRARAERDAWRQKVGAR